MVIDEERAFYMVSVLPKLIITQYKANLDAIMAVRFICRCVRVPLAFFLFFFHLVGWFICMSVCLLVYITMAAHYDTLNQLLGISF